MGFISDAVSGISGALGGLANSALSYKYSKKLMDYQNKLDIQNWNMVNAYNTPSAQMARYADAGLNPNLIYGQSNTAGNISQPGAKMDVDVAGPAMQAIDLHSRMKQMKADTDNKTKQNSLLQSQTDYVNEQVEGQALENLLKRKLIKSIGEGNPNDPYWYRDLKKHPLLGGISSFLGRVVGAVGSAVASPSWTVRYNGKEYTANSDYEAQEILRLLNSKGRLTNRKDYGGR